MLIPHFIRQHYTELTAPAEPKSAEQVYFSTRVHPNPFFLEQADAEVEEEIDANKEFELTSFYSWLLEGAHHFSVDVHGASWVPELVWQFVEHSPSAKASFPDPFGKDQVVFQPSLSVCVFWSGPPQACYIRKRPSTLRTRFCFHHTPTHPPPHFN